MRHEPSAFFPDAAFRAPTPGSERPRDEHRAPARRAAIDLTPDEFRRIGYALVDAAAATLESLDEMPASPGLTPSIVRAALGDDALPIEGSDAATAMRRAAELLRRYSTFNGHPRFMGYVTAGAAPIGVLAELLAATVNANCGAWSLSPLASEIERRAVRWIAELLGFPGDSGGVFVSGGNMANIVAVLAARVARARWNVREQGVTPPPGEGALVVYASTETHTWIQKAMEIGGFGERSLRWIPVDGEQRMRAELLRDRVREDRARGLTPLLVVGTAGTVSTGAIDPLRRIAEICREEDVWFHVDGAYGAPAAILPEASDDHRALALADSVAVDPHKWLYAPLEAGCVLVRDAEALHEAFHHRPPYYHFQGMPDDAPTNFHEWGPQNSRGFRALKVWLAIQQVGRAGYERMIRDDIALARAMDARVRELPDLEPATCRLSITTFRFVPSDLRGAPGGGREEYLDRLNTALLSSMQELGLAYVSNAVLDGRFHLRACIVNFRTSERDARAVPELAVRIGRAIDRRWRGEGSPYRLASPADVEAERHPLERLSDGWWSGLRERLERALAATMETATMLSRSPGLSARRHAAGAVEDVVRRLTVEDGRATAAIAALRGIAGGSDGGAPASGRDAAPLEALRGAHAALLAALAAVTPDDRIVERGIVQEVERRAIAYETELERLR